MRAPSIHDTYDRTDEYTDDDEAEGLWAFTLVLVLITFGLLVWAL